MEDYESSQSPQDEGVSRWPQEESSCSSIDSTYNLTPTKYGFRPSGTNTRPVREAFGRASKLRDRIYRSRLRLKERRIELQEERNAVSELDTKFMKGIRQFWQQGFLHEKTSLEEIYEQLESKRDEIGSLQYEYDQAEEEHEAIEARLEKEERRSHQSRHTANLGNDDDVDVQSVDGTTELYEPSLDFAGKDRHYETSYRQYQSRIGDARIMKERLQDYSIELSKRVIAAENMAVAGFESNMSVSPSVEDLKTFYCETEAELKIIEKDIEHMEKGLKELTVPISTQLSFSKPDASSGTNSPCSSTLNSPKQLSSRSTLSSVGPYPSILNSLKQLSSRSTRSSISRVRPHLKDLVRRPFRETPVKLMDIRSAPHRDSINSVNERLWVQQVLRSSDEFGDISSSKYGASIDSRDQLIENRRMERSRLFVFYPSQALKALHESNLQFPTTVGLHFRTQSELPWPTFNRPNASHRNEILEIEAFPYHKFCNHREVPYTNEILDLDLFSEYESRSV